MFSGLGGGSSNLATVALFISKIESIDVKKIYRICHNISSDSCIFFGNRKFVKVTNYGLKLKECQPKYLVTDIFINNYKQSTRKVFYTYKSMNQREKNVARSNLNDLLYPALACNDKLRGKFNEICALKKEKSVTSISGSGGTIIRLKKMDNFVYKEPRIH